MMLEIKRTRQPLGPVVLCTVPPSAHHNVRVDEEQRRLLNQGLRQFTEKSKLVAIVDLHAALSTAQGAPDGQYFTSDWLHI